MTVLIPTVRNVRDVGKRTNDHQVYVGRRTKWGNPYYMSQHGSREEVVELFRKYFYGSGTLMGAIHELEGKDLICWCAPLPCHADILLEFANRNN